MSKFSMGDDLNLPVDLPPVVSIVGRSNTGKTTLMIKLIAELKCRGYRVGTVKHHLRDFDVDVPGKDSWRHAQAGSDVAFIASPQKLAMIRKLDHEWPIDEIAGMCKDVDILLTEGYKEGDKLKIEISRKEMGIDLLCGAHELIAIVSDHRFDLNVPQFGLDDQVGVVNLLEKKLLGITKQKR